MDPDLQHVFDFVATASPETVDEYGRSSLHYCAQHGSLNALGILLSFGYFNVNQQDCLGNPPLLAVLQNYSAFDPVHIWHIVELLLRYGANPNLCSPICPTPIMIAVLHKDNPLVNLLLQYGADPNQQIQEEGVLISAGSSAISLCMQDPLECLSI